MRTDRPGREIPKDYRPIIEDLIDNQGWRYSTGGKGHPRLYPVDQTQSMIVISGTPGNERARPEEPHPCGREGRRERQMTWYSVRVATRNPDGGEPRGELRGVDDFTDQLADLDGVISAGAAGWGATISIDDDQAHAAARHGLDAIAKAARNAGLPAWPVVRLEVLDHDEFDRDLRRPQLPDMVSGPEAAEILEVTRQRLHQLREKPGFPAPLIERPGATLWARAAIELFAERWDRKPGRPVKVVEEAHRDH